MAVAIQRISPVAHVPLVLGVVRQLDVATLIETFCPPHPAHVLACGRGAEALLLAILDGHQARSKVGARPEERGRLPLRQPGLVRAVLHDDRLGQLLDALFAANLNRVFGAVALHAPAVYAISPSWLPQERPTITLSGAAEEAARQESQSQQAPERPVPPRPAYGPSKDGRDDRNQVLLSLGVSRDGLPLRLGVRDGHTSDSPEPPVAIAEWRALGLGGARGMVADRKAYCPRPLGFCLEKRVGLMTLVPRTWAVRQELEVWGQRHGTWPLLLEKPGRPRQAPPRRWDGQSVIRRVAVASTDGRQAIAEIRFRVVHSSPLAYQAAGVYAAAQAKAATHVAEHAQPVTARRCACVAEAAAAIAGHEGRGQGRRGRKPRPWRDHALHDRVEAVTPRPQRTQRAPLPRQSCPKRPSAIASGSREKPTCHPLIPMAGQSWPPRAGAESCTDAARLQADQEQHTPVEPGCRWIKSPAAISPVWPEKPERMAALAMLTVVGLLVEAVIQRQVRLSRGAHAHHVPGNQGATATPTATVVFTLFAPVTLVQFAGEGRISVQVHGLQPHHLLICEAVGLDPPWYRVPAIR